MQFTIAATTALACLFTEAMAGPYFHCPAVNETGFLPSCCHSITGQVGVECISAMIIGGLPNYDCNTGPPVNVKGCCQSLNYTNPDTGYSLHVCTDSSPVDK